MLNLRGRESKLNSCKILPRASHVETRNVFDMRMYLIWRFALDKCSENDMMTGGGNVGGEDVDARVQNRRAAQNKRSLNSSD